MFSLLFVFGSIIMIHLGFRSRYEGLRLIFQCLYMISLVVITLTLCYSYQKLIHPLLWLPIFIWMLVFFIVYRSFSWVQFFLYLFLLEWKSHWFFRLLSHLMFGFCMVVLGLTLMFRGFSIVSLEYSVVSPNPYRRIDVYHIDQGALGLDVQVSLVDTYGMLERIQHYPIDDSNKQEDFYWIDENTLQTKNQIFHFKQH